MIILGSIGNQMLWDKEKTLFLSSRRAPIGSYEKVFRWADSITGSDVVVCFNTSEFEKEMLKTLLVNGVPTVLVVTDRFDDKYNIQVERALKEQRLLILILQCEDSDGKGSTAFRRNQYVINHVDHIVCGFINKSGSIYPLIHKLKNVEYLLDDDEYALAAEASPSIARWTVMEDKWLMHYHYADMGLHSIHKQIGRPYSSIRQRIKAIAMNDEVIKGREFEDYVVERFDVANADELVLKDWRGDKMVDGVIPESNLLPDLLFDYCGESFAIECKWRNKMPRSLSQELMSEDKYHLYKQYSEDQQCKVFIALGIGGLPSDPSLFFLTELSQHITSKKLLSISPDDDILELIKPMLTNQGKRNSDKEERPANAYARWRSTDDERLKELFLAGLSVNELMLFFGRKEGGIRSRLKKLGYMLTE